MALESQGCLIRRESSVAGTTATLSTNTLGFNDDNNRITRQAGFADFSTGMRIEVKSSLNEGVFTISDTAGTYIGVYESITSQASGDNATITGHAMQNIGEVVSFNGPSLTGAVIDLTNLQSTAKEKTVGVYDAGDLSISVNWDNEASNAAIHDALVIDMRARTNRKFDIKFTDTGTSQPSGVYFEGYITGFNPTGSVDNKLSADITIAISTGVYFIDQV